MNGIEGAGGSDTLRRALVEAAQSIRGTTERNLASEEEDGPGMQGALELSRSHLSESLAESGFIDIHAGSIARMEAYLRRANAEPEEVGIEMDPKMASEIAVHMGRELTEEIDQVLRILARVHPERVAMLLR